MQLCVIVGQSNFSVADPAGLKMDVNGGEIIRAGGPIQLCGRASVLERANMSPGSGRQDLVFNGLLSQLAIFDAPLSPSQIAALYKRVSLVKPCLGSLAVYLQCLHVPLLASQTTLAGWQVPVQGHQA